MIELITISQAGQTWYLNKIIVNPKYVSTVSESQDGCLKWLWRACRCWITNKHNGKDQ